MPEEIAIKVDSVSKTFKLPHEKQNSIKGAFVNLFKGRRTYEKQKVVDNVSFEIKKGEFYGIVGRNGSGKSTLLKLLADIYTPDSGAIQIDGKLTPFIELGVGFNPELTGRENVYLNGALLGFSRKEMNEMYGEIVEFAELEKFMDQKLKNYSSGMQVRLAFSIAIRANSDILLLDEVLAVGDENFQRKCYGYFSKLKKEGRTVILVSHDMSAVRDYCTKALLLHAGKVVEMGSVKKVIERYQQLNIQDLETLAVTHAKGSQGHEQGNEAHIKSAWTSSSGKKQTVFTPNDKVVVNIQITTAKQLLKPVIGMIFQDQQGKVIFATNTNELNIDTGVVPAKKTVTAIFSVDNVLTNGAYSVSCAITNSDRSQVYSRVEEICRFEVVGRSMTHSLTHPPHSFELTTKAKA